MSSVCTMASGLEDSWAVRLGDVFCAADNGVVPELWASD